MISRPPSEIQTLIENHINGFNSQNTAFLKCFWGHRDVLLEVANYLTRGVHDENACVVPRPQGGSRATASIKCHRATLDPVERSYPSRRFAPGDYPTEARPYLSDGDGTPFRYRSPHPGTGEAPALVPPSGAFPRSQRLPTIRWAALALTLARMIA